MTTRAYAAWVAPIAEQLRQQREELVALVRSVPAEAWSRPSPNDGWSYRDLLGHLATRDARDWHYIVSSVVSKTPLDPAKLQPEEDVPVNDGLLAEVGLLSPDQVADKVTSDTDAFLDLLAQLGDEHKELRQGDFPLSFGEALEQLPNHERMHMDQLRTALEEEERT